MSICQTPLPPACEKEVQRLVSLVPDNELAPLASTEPAFQTGGFRAGNTAALRLRAQQLVSGSPEISDALRRLLARRSRSHALTRLLSLDALTENRHALAVLLTPHALLVALLLDARADVRAKAQEWLTSASPHLNTEPAAALGQLRESFESFAELLGHAPAGEAYPATRENWREQKEQLDLRIVDLLAQNRRLRGVDDRLSGLSQQLKTCEEKLAAARQKGEAAEAALRQKTRECEATAAELARETTHREERLTAALDLALAREFHGWLSHARAVEAAAAEVQAQSDLLSQAESALKNQGELDRHSGNRLLLGDRLSQLESAHQRVASALRYALRQSPELKRIEAELASEIRRIRNLLDPEPSETPFEQAVVARIHAAHDNDLPRLRDLPDFVESLRFLDGAALARVRLAFQKRLSATQAAGVPPDTVTEARKGAVSLLGRALSGQIAAILLLDGHNVIFGLPVRYNPPRGGALSDADKRKKLADDIVRIASPNPALRAWIVFDGPTRHDAQAAANVRVTYSGGTGEHRADGVILDNIRFFKNSSPDTPVILVSNDTDLCQSARRLGAENIAVLDLGAFL